MTHADRHRRPLTAWVLLTLLIVQGLGGIAGGLSLTVAPDGSIMKMSTSLLDGSPFHDFPIPGLILGVGLLVFVFTLLRPVRRYYGVSLPGES